MGKQQEINIGLNITAETKNARAAIEQLADALNNKNLGGSDRNGINKLIAQLTSGLQDLEAKASKPMSTLSDISKVSTSYEKVTNLVKRLSIEMETLNGKDGIKLVQAFDDLYQPLKKATDAAKEFEKVLDKQQQGYEKTSTSIAEQTKELENLRKERERLSSKKTDDSKFTKSLAESSSILIQEQGVLKKYEKRLKEVRDAQADFTVALADSNLKLTNKGNIDQRQSSKNTMAYKGQELDAKAALEMQQKLAQAEQNAAKEVANHRAEVEKLTIAHQELQSQSFTKEDQAAALKKNQEEIDRTEEKLQKLKATVEGYDTNAKTAFDNAKKALEGLVPQDTLNKLQYSREAWTGLKDIIDNLTTQTVGEAKVRVEELVQATANIAPAISPAEQAIQGVVKQITDLTDREKDIQSLTNRLMYFFSLGNMAMLFRRGINQAVTTIKELDAAMTATAVVTDYTVSDMWKTLGEATKQANALGVAVKDVYEAQTLYYEQGLSTTEVNDMVNATLRLERIAALDASDAVDRLTNAMRGFNMTINEANADLVVDVYSNLAANAAANVDEISTAMTKVASIANSANMSYEKTAALLTAGIETTRESAETIGTSLKTVVARFAEVKSLYSKDELMGKDEEGEDIDVNKVSTALRSAGINLNEFFTGAKGLDDILYELASKWNGLDLVTQRYIATMAAGSRQQSRFIAMMQDYSRLTELTGYAENAAGASTKQFEKTLDSLESKLAELKNAWDAFLMGITNSNVVKIAVDGLTMLLNVINSILDVVGKFGGVPKMIASIALAFNGLKIAKSLTAGLAVALSPKSGAALGAGFMAGFKAQLAQEFTNDKIGSKLISSVYQSKMASQSSAELSIKSEISAIEYEIAAAKEMQALSSAKSVEYAELQKTIDAQTNNLAAANLKLKQLQNGTISATVKNELLEEQIGAIGLKNSAAETALKKAECSWETKMLILQNDQLRSQFMELAALEDEAAIKAFIAKIEAASVKYVGTNVVVTKLANQAWARQLGLVKATEAGVYAINGAMLGTVAIIGAAVAALIYFNPDNTLKRINSRIEETESKISETKTQLEDLDTTLQSISDKQADLNNLTKGSEEWASAVEDINNEYKSLLEKIPELQKYTEYDKDTGIFSISEEGISEYKDKLNNEINDANEDLTNDLDKSMRQYSRKFNNRYRALTDTNYNGTGDFNAFRQASEGDLQKYLEEDYNDYLTALSKAQNYAVSKSFDPYKNQNNSEELYDFLNDSFENFYSISEDIESAADKMKSAADLISSKYSTDNNVIGKIINSENGLGLTSNDINKLNDVLNSDPNQYEGQLRYLDYDIADIKTIFGTIENFVSYISANADALDQAAEKFETIGITDLSKVADYDAFSKQQMANSLEAAAKNGGNVGAIWDALIAAIPKDKDKAAEFINLFFSESALTDADSFDNAVAAAEEAGIATEGFAEKVKEAANIVNKFSVDKLVNSTKTLGEVQKLLQEAKAEGKTSFSEEDYEKIISQAPELANQFHWNITSGEYDFVGNIDSDLQIIIGKIDEILNGGIETTEENIARGKQVEGTLNNVYSDGTYGLTGQEYIDQLRSGATNLNSANVLSLAKDMGIDQSLIDNAKDQEATSDQFAILAQAIVSAFDTYYGENGGQLQANEETLRQTELTQATYNQDTGQGLVNLANIDPQKAQEYEGQLDNLIEKELGLKEAVDKQIESLDKNDAAYNQNKRLIKALAVDANNASKKFENMSKVIADNSEDLRKADTDFKAYREAIHEVALAASEAFNTNITDDFVAQKLQAFQDYANGVEGAEERIQAALIDTFELGVDKANALSDAISWLNGQDLDISGSADFSQIFTELANLMNDANTAAKYLESLGYEIEWEETPGKTITAGFKEVRGELIPVQKTIPQYRAKVTKTSGSGFGGGKGSSSGGSGGGGGGSSSDKSKVWDNSYDKYYNLQEDLNELVREREQIQFDYNRLLKDENTSFLDIQANRQAELKNLRKQLQLEQQLQAGRREQLQNVANERYTDDEGNRTTYAATGATAYASYNWKDNTIEIDWDRINQITDESLGKAVEAYVSRLEELQDQFDETIDNIEEIKDTIDDIYEENKQDYLDFENRIKDALVQSMQNDIDTAQAIADSVSESQSRIFDSIQESIDLSRQIRDNTKTEEEIANKEARLAYLQRDTSGANQTEIRSLQKEIDEAKQNYSDTLVDQELDALQKRADEEQESRQQQIEIQQQILDYMDENGLFWKDVYALLSGADENGNLQLTSDLVNKLQETEAFNALSEFGKMDWIDTLIDAFNVAMVGEANWQFEKAKKEGSITANGKTYKYNAKSGTFVDSKGNSVEATWNANKQSWNVVEPVTSTKPTTSTSSSSASTPAAVAAKTGSGILANLGKVGLSSHPSSTVFKDVKTLQQGLNTLIEDGIINVAKLDVDGRYGSKTQAAVKKMQTLLGVTVDGSWGAKTYAAFMNSKWKSYSTGGLADYTGPAWLDGTKSKPELVLDAADTANFLTIRNILNELLKHNNGNVSNSGDNYYNISIDAEIGSDYDVDRLAERLKKRIYDDSTYRNVHSISYLR